MKKSIPIFLVAIFFIAISIFISKNIQTKHEKVKRKASGAMESLQWMSEIRAYPDKDIPKDKFYKAFEYSSTKLTQLNDNPNLD